MTSTERALLAGEIDRLNRSIEGLAVALQALVDKGRPIPPEDPGEGPVGVMAHYEWREWDLARLALEQIRGRT